ncbi:cyclophilin type peptidyl-prolyl cis-trans isomerase/CLD domain-containing protein [Ditylenchus destructor]|nr:cyclophilin type peptidyl-prolyl cis-trans isomerase/CLD domain-containing protein [Ditylenchus destructor]
MKNPIVFLELSADGDPIGRMVFELYAEKAPKTVENFRVLCTGENDFGYKGCLFYRVIPGFCACSGDFETNNADRSGGRSIYGEKYFEDEHNNLSHNSRGILSMDNYGWPDTNSSRFFVTFNNCEWMDGYHIAFGKLTDGFDALDRLESYGTIKGYGAQKGQTTKEIRIINCGQL